MSDPLVWALQEARQQTLTLVADVPEGRMCQQAVAGEQHPAWVLGHLLVADLYLLSLVGRQSLGPDFAVLLRAHGPGAVPGPAAEGYYAKSALVGRLAEAGAARVEAVKLMSGADLARPLPDEALAQAQPTVGHHLYALVFHEGYHGGQLSGWRRAHGFGPARWALGPKAPGGA